MRRSDGAHDPASRFIQTIPFLVDRHVMDRRFALTLLALAAPLTAAAQPSTVTRSEHFTIEVDGAPFYPLGWNLVGHCAELPEQRFEVMLDSLDAEMERIRAYGLNATFESGSGDGRYAPHKVDDGRYNWINYTFTDVEGRERQRGHIRSAVYVAALRRYLDLAYYGADGNASRPIRTFVSLTQYTIPEGSASPYGGSDTLRCDAYRRVIEEERARLAAADSDLADLVPAVACEDGTRLPFWEWNVRYIVQSLRDHPGVLAWYLWDEPEGVTWRHLFGIVPPGTRPRRYTGPESLPTPDLLRHAYRRVRDFELEGRPSSYQRHPILVDLYDVEVFFSDRFAWSRDGDLRPEYHSGPFDRTPEGDFDTPADLLGLDASVYAFETAAYSDQPPHGWYWDPNLISRRSEMMRDAVERDSLWSGLVISGQSWLASGGPFGVPEPLRCPMNERPRLALLNDRDLVWHLLTPQINGLRGELYYARSYNPYEGVGAEQVARTDRLMQQFRDAEFDRVFSAPSLTSGWGVASIDIEALTNYFRSDPDFVGPADAYDPGRSVHSLSGPLSDPAAYQAGTFTRSDAPDSYGHPTRRSGVQTTYPAHRLLRTALHRYEGALYLFVSNAYDARITARFQFDAGMTDGLTVREGRFDLDADGTFEWTPAQDRLRTSSLAGAHMLDVGFEPYEVRIFRLTP